MNIGEDVGVGGHVEAGEILGGADSNIVLSQDRPDFTGAFEALDCEFLICGIGEPVRVDDRRVSHISAGDCNITTGKGGDKTRVDGGVVVAVTRVFGLSVRLVAEVSTDG